MINASILIVDDEPVYLELLKALLIQEGYNEVLTEKNPLNVMPLLKSRKIDLIISDIYMPEMNGLELLELITCNFPTIPVIMVTAIDDTAIALKAVKAGAYEFITKPPDTDRLFLTIKRALEQKILTLERDTLRSNAINPALNRASFSDVIAESPNMLKVFELVEIFAATDETILLLGETGTGKDLIAQKIHQLSSRRDKPFIAVNLASISSSLFESELFGYERGAYTGAAKSGVGYFESANGGTIFLDEIGELPKELQGKLLRVIQYGEISRLGSPKPINLDIRIVAATNKDLLKAVNENQYRADLFYRLNRGYIELPPLRKRGNDIQLLAEYFYKQGCKVYNKELKGFGKNIMAKMLHYPFPGNIRELENIVMNAVAKTPAGEPILNIDIRNDESINLPESEVLLTLDEAMEQYVVKVLGRVNNNTTKAAAILGISERTLQRRLHDYRLKNT